MAATKAQIKLAEERGKWWRSKLNHRRGKLNEWKTAGNRGHEWLKKHQQAKNAAGEKSAQASIERARQMIRKWTPLVAEAEKETKRYDDYIAKNKPATTGTTVAAQEAELARKYPQTQDGVRKVVAKIKAKFPDIYVTSTTGGAHAKGSYHYQGRAFDLASANMNAQAVWIQQNMAQLLTEGIHNTGLSVKNRQPVAPGYWGPVTWANHANHHHVAV